MSSASYKNYLIQKIITQATCVTSTVLVDRLARQQRLSVTLRVHKRIRHFSIHRTVQITQHQLYALVGTYANIEIPRSTGVPCKIARCEIVLKEPSDIEKQLQKIPLNKSLSLSRNIRMCKGLFTTKIDCNNVCEHQPLFSVVLPSRSAAWWQYRDIQSPGTVHAMETW